MKRTLLIAIVVGLAVPTPAHAHLMNTGLGPFYDGLAHLFVSPEDLLPVIALALLAGLRGPASGRAVLFTLPIMWLIGSFAGTWAATVAHPAAWRAATAAITFAIGALVAADIALPLGLTIAIAGVLGLLHGGLSSAELAEHHGLGLSAIGTAAALFVVVSLLAGEATAIRATKARIVVRVAGSWIAAIALLMFGWSFHA